MKELGIDDVVNISYTNKKYYCNKYKYLVETEKNLVIKENEEEDFFEYKLKFSGDSSGYITAEIKIDKKNKKDKKDIPKFQFYQNQLLIVAKTAKYILSKITNAHRRFRNSYRYCIRNKVHPESRNARWYGWYLKSVFPVPAAMRNLLGSTRRLS